MLDFSVVFVTIAMIIWSYLDFISTLTTQRIGSIVTSFYLTNFRILGAKGVMWPRVEHLPSKNQALGSTLSTDGFQLKILQSHGKMQLKKSLRHGCKRFLA